MSSRCPEDVFRVSVFLNPLKMVIDLGEELAAYPIQTPNNEPLKTRQLPVTLLSGFLVWIRPIPTAKTQTDLMIGQWQDDSPQTYSQVLRSWAAHCGHCE